MCFILCLHPSLSNHVLRNAFQIIRRLKDDLVMKNQDIKITSERLLDLMVSMVGSPLNCLNDHPLRRREVGWGGGGGKGGVWP